MTFDIFHVGETFMKPSVKALHLYLFSSYLQIKNVKKDYNHNWENALILLSFFTILNEFAIDAQFPIPLQIGSSFQDLLSKHILITAGCIF